jgi:hypothetical protein
MAFPYGCYPVDLAPMGSGRWLVKGRQQGCGWRFSDLHSVLILMIKRHRESLEPEIFRLFRQGLESVKVMDFL